MSLEAKKIKPGNSKNEYLRYYKNCSLNEEDEFKLMKYIQKKQDIYKHTFFKKAVDRLTNLKFQHLRLAQENVTIIYL